MLKFSSLILSVSLFLSSKFNDLWPEEFLEDPEELEFALPILETSLVDVSLLAALKCLVFWYLWLPPDVLVPITIDLLAAKPFHHNLKHSLTLIVCPWLMSHDGSHLF